MAKEARLQELDSGRDVLTHQLVRRSRRHPLCAPVFFVGWFFGWLEAKQPSRWSGLRNEAPAREPAKERTEHDPGLRCKGNIGGQTDDNAERQAQHGSERDGGSDAHMRECMTATR
jgi:hypothetical protein